MTILLLAHNEKENVIKVIEHFRKLRINGFDFSLILVDNGSTDDLKDWAKDQNDFIYTNYQNMVPWSFAIKRVFNNFDICNQVLIMKPNFYPAELGCLNDLSEKLNEDENCAMISPVFTASVYDESLYGKYGDVYRIVKPTNNFILFKKDIFRKVNILENIWTVGAFNLSIIIQITKMGYTFKQLNVPVLKDPYNYYEDADSLNHMDDDKKLIDEEYKIHYFSGANYYLTKLINIEDKNSPIKVFEVGCDSGATLLHIKEHYPNATIIGCDINTNIVELASHCLDKAFVADIERDNIPIEPESLDYIIFGDVLEHLRNPDYALQLAHALLKPGGRVLASIPNTMHISVMRDLLQGNFTYENYGLLDKTHIHLFTLNEIAKLFAQNGYAVEICTYNQQPLSDDDNKLIDKLMEISDKCVARYMYEAYQYQIRAIKKV